MNPDDHKLLLVILAQLQAIAASLASIDAKLGAKQP
jgi:hypothetical protein